MIEIEYLLKKIKKIINKNDEISKLKGESFNIFSVLNLDSKENVLHSKLLTELLDTNGSHGYKDMFLKLFIAFLKNEICGEFEFNALNSRAKTEKSIGKVDLINKTGGRIDISIHDSLYEIIIENKIYTGEQENQIERYCNYAKSNNAKVFYLTLHGEEPKSGGEKYQLNRDYFKLSYSNDIIKWLELCKKEVVDSPIIRETIKQYIILLKKITGQLNNDNMNTEVKIEILNNYEAAKQIKNSFEDINQDIMEFWKKIKELILKNQYILDNNWSVELSNNNLMIDILNHGRGNFAIYIENIFSTPYYSIWLSKAKYDNSKLEQYIRTKNLNLDLSATYLYKEEISIDWAKAEHIKKIYNEDVIDLKKEISDKVISIAKENVVHLKVLNKFKIN